MTFGDVLDLAIFQNFKIIQSIVAVSESQNIDFLANIFLKSHFLPE